MKNLKTFEEYINESNNNLITFSVDDEKLDQILHDFHERELDYVDDKGDSLYTLPKKEFDRFISYADDKGFDVDYEGSEDSVIYVKESIVNEGAVKQFEVDYTNLVKNVKTGYGWIDPEFVEETWNNTGNSIDFAIVKDEVLNRLIKADLLYFADDKDPEEKGKKVSNISQIK